MFKLRLVLAKRKWERILERIMSEDSEVEGKLHI